MRYYVVTHYKRDGSEVKTTVEYTWEVDELYKEFIRNEHIVSIAVHRRDT